ncbi:MAG TPA: GntR family transcriptional regulator [Chloroflexaceae bacterium]|nr:GntR family transcriptional regulator [Chloroflexaceae bacterium]
MQLLRVVAGGQSMGDLKTQMKQARDLDSGTHTGSLVEQAYANLKLRIILCELAPGAHITEHQLCTELGISKTPVREALTRLIQEGLVHSLPRQGYEVTPITLGDVNDLFDLRMLIIPSMIERAAPRINIEELRHIDLVCQRGYTLPDTRQISEYLRASRDFYVTIAKATGNRRIIELVDRLEDEGQRLFHLALMFRHARNQVRYGHKELVEALAAGEAQRAAAIASEAIRLAQKEVTEALLSSPAILAARVEAPRAPHDWGDGGK